MSKAINILRKIVHQIGSIYKIKFARFKIIMEMVFRLQVFEDVTL
jgi:hypothetical protein